MADYMQFKTRNREIVDIDISAAALEPIGFEFNCRIMTPKGPAKVYVCFFFKYDSYY